MKEELESDKPEQKPRTREDILNEIKRLSERAQKETEGKQGELFEDLPTDTEDEGFDVNILNDTVNPALSHRLYYSIQRMMRDNLPQGDEYKRLRRAVYDEKNLFLNQGKAKDQRGIRGSDGRMTFPHSILQVAFDTAAKWVREGAVAYDLLARFEDLNKQHGNRS